MAQKKLVVKNLDEMNRSELNQAVKNYQKVGEAIVIAFPQLVDTYLQKAVGDFRTGFMLGEKRFPLHNLHDNAIEVRKQLHDLMRVSERV